MNYDEAFNQCLNEIRFKEIERYLKKQIRFNKSVKKFMKAGLIFGFMTYKKLRRFDKKFDIFEKKIDSLEGDEYLDA